MTDYTSNPLDSNIFFGIGQPIMLILLSFTAIAGLIFLISKIGKLSGLEIAVEPWLKRFLLITLHVGLIWLGSSMLISYLSLSAIDAIAGAALLLGAVTSTVYHITSDNRKARHTLVISYAFLAAIMLWAFIFSGVLDALPFQIRDVISDTWRPAFFKDLFSYWRWM